MDEDAVVTLYEKTIEMRRRVAAWQSGDPSISTGEVHNLIQDIVRSDEILRGISDQNRQVSRAEGRARWSLVSQIAVPPLGAEGRSAVRSSTTTKGRRERRAPWRKPHVPSLGALDPA